MTKEEVKPQLGAICTEFLVYILEGVIDRKGIKRRLTIDEIDDIKKEVKNKIMEICRNLDYDFEISDFDHNDNSYDLEIFPSNLYTCLFALDKINRTKQSETKDKKEACIDGITYSVKETDEGLVLQTEKKNR
jgi:hypothetical protein